MQGTNRELNAAKIIILDKLNLVFENDGYKFEWKEKCKNILIVCKKDESVYLGLKTILHYLIKKFDYVIVYIDDKIHAEFGEDKAFNSSRIFGLNLKNKIENKSIDLVITLGGDGTLLYLSSLIQGVHPPVISFYMGSLGFLTNFDLATFDKTLPLVMEGPCSCVLRSRLKCEIIRSKVKENKSAICKEALAHEFYLSEIYGSAMRLPEACSLSDDKDLNKEPPFNTLNEIVVHRGLSPFLLYLKLTVNGKEITDMQGDGLLISTPTGSTAYAMSAGATMLHPSVPAIMITPINPHTLNCRPICLPTNSVIELELSSNSSSMTAHVNCDGQAGGYSLLAKGDKLRITTSDYPIPCICSESQVSDWFSGLAQCLNWNVRHHQSEFNHSRFTDTSSIVSDPSKTKNDTIKSFGSITLNDVTKPAD